MRTSIVFFMTCVGMMGMSPAFAADDGARFTAFAGFDLGIGTLDDVQHRLGATQAVHTGDAGESETRICYSTPNGVVGFLSGEMGSNSDLLGFSVSSARDRRCARWPRAVPVPALQLAGIRPGMTRRQFESAIGAKVDWQKNGDGQASFESKRKPTASELAALPESERADAMLDVVVSVIARFSGGRLIEVQAWKVETN